MPRPLMIQGTASHVGKSVLTAAFGRWLVDQKIAVAPFKAQNMSLNSFVTLEGEEIARSQAMQAEALGLEASADMNPILLKPMQRGCQVILQGKSAGFMSIQEYYAFKPAAWKAITESWDRLSSKHNVIVLEGAGSPAEINLRENDLVNMRMAEYADAKVILVADIERGGCFAQLVGTWELLASSERERIIGFLINKFQGDASLLDSGLRYIRERTGRPVLGVLPFDPRVQLDEEDSLGLVARSLHERPAPPERADCEINITVIRLPGISNFTDFASLARLPGVAVSYVTQPDQLDHADMVILPGTRTTVHALRWLRQSGLAKCLEEQATRSDGPIILGLCGGYQMLGKTIEDPEQIESAEHCCQGLGLLDVDTRFTAGKSLHRVEAEVIGDNNLGSGAKIIGYEIHHGQTRRRDGVIAWLRLHRQPGGEIIEDGAVSMAGRVLGTYVHGLFDDARFARSVLDALRRRRGLPALREESWLSQRQFLAQRYAYLPQWLAAHCDLHFVAKALGIQ